MSDPGVRALGQGVWLRLRKKSQSQHIEKLHSEMSDLRLCSGVYCLLYQSDDLTRFNPPNC